MRNPTSSSRTCLFRSPTAPTPPDDDGRWLKSSLENADAAKPSLIFVGIAGAAAARRRYGGGASTA